MRTEQESVKNCIDDHLYACRMCGAPHIRFFLSVEGLDYHRCDRCKATVLDRARWLSAETEYAHYLNHENNVADTAYRRFLSRLVDPLLKKLAAGRDGLDYGCGPGPALAHMLSEAGHNMSLFDPFFFPDQALLGRRYDFITCTEAIEHFHHPAEDFARFERMLRPGGWLAIMTCFQGDDDQFPLWYYRRDPTHVIFYREETLRHIARSFGWSCTFPVKDVALMQKPLNR